MSIYSELRDYQRELMKQIRDLGRIRETKLWRGRRFNVRKARVIHVRRSAGGAA